MIGTYIILVLQIPYLEEFLEFDSINLYRGRYLYGMELAHNTFYA